MLLQRCQRSHHLQIVYLKPLAIVSPILFPLKGLERDVDHHHLFKPRSNKMEERTAVGEFHFHGGQIQSQNQPPTVEGPRGSPERENFCV